MSRPVPSHFRWYKTERHTTLFTCDAKAPLTTRMILCTLFVIVALYAYYKIDKYFHDQRIDDVSKKCVLVTGCDSGFGSVLPVRLDTYGVTCFAGCLTQDGVDRLKEKCSDNVKPLLIDVADSESIQSAFDYVKSNIPAGKG